MTKVKKIIAILSTILMIGVIIYQVNAYDGYVGEPVVLDDEIVEESEGYSLYEEDSLPGEDYLLEDEEYYTEITSLPEDVILDEGELLESEEIEDDGYIDIEPLIANPLSTAVSFLDATTNRLKHVQIHVDTVYTPRGQLSISIAPDVEGVFSVGDVTHTVLIGDIIPPNWVVDSWQIQYYTGHTGVHFHTYTTLVDGHILHHNLPPEICLDTDFWVMLPTFIVNLTPIPPTLTGTVTCTTCPEVGPGTPMPGVTIELHYYCEDAGDVVRTQVTNANGFFDFGQVPLGDLRLVKIDDTVPEGHVSIESRVFEFTTTTPAGTYERHFFVECKIPPTLTKTATHINGEPITAEDLVVDGDVVTYRLRVSNPNPRPWSNFLLVDELPPGLTLVGDVEVVPVAALVTDNSAPAGVNVILNLPASPTNVDVIFTARVDDVTLAVNGIFRNIATLYGPPPEEGGPRPPVDDCDEDIPVRPPGVSLVKAVSSPEAEPGEDLTYTLIVRNTGGAVLTNVIVTDDLPVQLTHPRNIVITPANAGEGNFEGRLLTVTIPRLGVGEAVTITFDVTVDPNVPNYTEIDNVSEVTTDQGVYDEDDATVTVSYEPPVLARPGLTLEKSVSAQAVLPGGNLTYTIIVRNTGDEVLTGVEVIDNLPVQLTNPRNLVITPTGAGTGGFVGQRLTVDIPVLGINEYVIIVFDVTVAGDVAHNTVIRNVASVTADQDVSDEDDASTTVTKEPPIQQPPPKAPRTGDIEAVETVLFMFITGTTALVMFSLLKTEKKKTRK